MPSEPTISAVVTTHNRAEQALNAVASILLQVPAVEEVFVCDDGSTDETPERIAALAAEEPRVRYHRFERARGGPGPGRNYALTQATGAWIAFLDDDDAWLPGKLAAQVPYLAAGDHDVVATNAVRTSGARYFAELDRPWEPSRRRLLHVNPVIISSAVVRRELLAGAGGFSDAPWLRRGPLDYHTWLRLSDAGARFVVLPEALVRYDDSADTRLSSSRGKIQRDLLRIAVTRWASRPYHPQLAEAVVRHLADTALVVAGDRRAKRADRRR